MGRVRHAVSRIRVRDQAAYRIRPYLAIIADDARSGGKEQIMVRFIAADHRHACVDISQDLPE